jgi:putative endopeptidase
LNRAIPLAALALACATAKPPPAAPAVGQAPGPAAPPAAPGIDLSIIDTAVSPCQDFYAYACGGWLRSTPLPGDQSRWVRSFNVMREENLARLRGVLDAAAAGKVDPEDRYGQQVADLYAGCMDLPAIENNGLAALRAEWRRLDEVNDPRGLAAALGRFHARSYGATLDDRDPERSIPLFGVGSTQDFKDSSKVIGGIAQAGLSLPDRDYYLKQDAKSAAIRKDFLAYVEKQLTAAGEPAAQAASEAKEILSLETAMAAAHWTRVEMRDPNRIYNRIDLSGLEKAAPHFDWKAYLGALGVSGVAAWTSTTPKALAGLDELVRKTPAEAWRAYLRWHLLVDAAALRSLPKAISEQAFWFRARHFSGEKAMPERWKHCVDLTDRLLGEALGQAFVRRFFAGGAKAKALSLVNGIQAAMGSRLDTLPWMDEATRAQAKQKLATVVNKIGYPERWKSYDGLALSRADFLGSAWAALAYEIRRDLDKIGKPLDRTEWGMTTPTVNAYYNPLLNEIVFPAGILQPPFYTQGANDAVNYGAIGLVVGHELTHGYDDEGRQFDARGNLADWWSKPVAAEFERRAQCVVKQYGGYPAIDDLKVNGELTLGENIADLGGLTLSLAAYRASRVGKLGEAPVGGYTADQQFFLAHAQAWCAQVSPENARLRVVNDPHSPPRWRVNGPLSSLPDFARAFHCSAGDPMLKAEGCEIW